MPEPIIKPLWRTATFWAGAATIVTAVGGWAQGTLMIADSLEMVAIAMIGIFLRRNMPK
jgi:hypothetical protein